MVLSFTLCSPARLLTFSRAKFWKPAVSIRFKLPLFVQRCCTTSETYVSSVNRFRTTTDEYKNLQKYFIRRLEAAYCRFSHIPDDSVVYGRNHVYFIQDDGIYRTEQRNGEKEPEHVINLEQISKGDGKTKPENEEIFHWTIQRIRLSPQEKHLATTFKCSHNDELRCVVVRLLNPHNILLKLERVLSLEWASDDVLVYTTLEGLRSTTVFRLDLTSSGSKITCVYEETQPDVFVEVAQSRDRQILTINCNSRTSSEVLLIDGAASHLNPFVVQPRQLDLLYHVEHWRGHLIILANTGPRQEYQVVVSPLSEPSMASWVALYTPDPGTAIKDMDVIGNHCVLVAKTPANELALIVVSLTHPKDPKIVQLPSWACAIETKKPGLADQQDVFEFLLSSPVHPPVPYSLYPKKELLLSGTGNVSSPENRARSITTRLEACSQDGTFVPVTLFHSAPLERLSQVPLLVHVYGAYGRDLNMEFCPVRRMLLEQGWALAYCHIRGGGERGLSWQRQAQVEGKTRGVEDLQACLNHLFSLGISSPSLTALTACSAGAVPVGALCNKNPNLMRAIVLHAPFLDVLGTMESPSLPLVLEDRDEWGNPVENLKHRQIISSYCPLHNIKPQHYPSMLLTAYSGDPRVPLEGVLKYVEHLNKAIHTHFSTKPKTDCKQIPNIVLNLQPGVNHLGPERFEQILEEEALKLAFLYTELGLDCPQPRHRRKR
ncbi:prolyl endopeptidase-like [Austrofundulus limnaeus]|uniref:Prolyl endopeptidase n=1 Tax=Austrofundulus limnaeus TaxID=52670 RepID=A0A2I4D0N6_AUSLI|nr:PREDICTED: prolyl endopeptidase-like [Austrofundulus limnaeus]